MTVESIVKTGARRTGVSSKQGSAVWTHSGRTQDPLNTQESQAEVSGLPGGPPEDLCVLTSSLEFCADFQALLW